MSAVEWAHHKTQLIFNFGFTVFGASYFRSDPQLINPLPHVNSLCVAGAVPISILNSYGNNVTTAENISDSASHTRDTDGLSYGLDLLNVDNWLNFFFTKLIIYSSSSVSPVYSYFC